MRMTLRSTGPLAVAGSPICSQIATDSPSFTSLRQILLDRVEGHAGHLDRRAGRLAARGQRDVEQPRGALGVVVEQLVEVAHAVEQQHVRMLRLDAQVLLHHRRMGRSGAAGGAAVTGAVGVPTVGTGPAVAADLGAEGGVPSGAPADGDIAPIIAAIAGVPPAPGCAPTRELRHNPASTIRRTPPPGTDGARRTRPRVTHPAAMTTEPLILVARAPPAGRSARAVDRAAPARRRPFREARRRRRRRRGRARARLGRAPSTASTPASVCSRDAHRRRADSATCNAACCCRTAAGAGPLLDDAIVRLMLALKIASLARGASGVRLAGDRAARSRWSTRASARACRRRDRSARRATSRRSRT